MKLLNAFIDHTLLNREATQFDIHKLCLEALEYQFASVCILPTQVEYATKLLKNSKVKVCSVVGFPLGGNTSKIKSAETQDLIALGATEIDMVINISAIKDRNFELVKNDILTVVQSAAPYIVKVILETCLLNDEEKKICCLLAKEAGAHFVKTSTGFSKGGATVQDVKLMKETVGNMMEVKASGGIRDYVTAMEMIEAGATRLGTSSGLVIVQPRVKQPSNCCKES